MTTQPLMVDLHCRCWKENMLHETRTSQWRGGAYSFGHTGYLPFEALFLQKGLAQSSSASGSRAVRRSASSPLVAASGFPQGSPTALGGGEGSLPRLETPNSRISTGRSIGRSSIGRSGAGTPMSRGSQRSNNFMHMEGLSGLAALSAQ
mmetsp:Transcript_153911/g.493545  ORF Transcript_153911/g.493545 Transcript_153911/m.493545 type:complete len:149 (-) Transcript_153911:133-579(-)